MDKEGDKGPSEEARKAVASVIALVEGCNPQDRGYVLNRLSQIYLGAKSAKQIRGALKSSKAVPKKSKTSWKADWEKTPEYQAWQSHISKHKGDTPEQRTAHQETYDALRGHAFRVRDEIKASRVNNSGGHDDEVGED